MKKIKIIGTNETLFYDKLNNGLDIYVIPNNNQKNFYITYNVKFGSINTEFKKDNEKTYKKVPNGIAHYMEHLMFNMENGSAFDFFSKLGASVNAFTSYNLTCYEVYSSTYFKENLEYLLDYVNTPYFTNELINNERGIITEEIKMYDNNPNTELTYRSLNNIFINDKRKYLISGSIDDIKHITKENIMECYNTFYNPNNMFVVITGNVNPYESIAIIEKNQSAKKFSNVKYINKDVIEPKSVNNKYQEVEMNVETNKVNISFKIQKKIFKKININNELLKIYISLLFDILYGVTSNLQNELICSKILSNGININKTYTNDYIVVSLTTETDYVETFIRYVENELGNISINKETLDRKIKVLKSNYILHFDDIEMVNNAIQDNIIENGQFINNYLELYNDINIETMQEIIKQIKSISKSILVIKPKNTN